MDFYDKETVIDVLIKHWSSTAIITDICNPMQSKTYTGRARDKDEQELTDEVLLPGEISAVIFRVGCYTVRRASRVYRVYESGYSPELEVPANREEVESVKNELAASTLALGDKLRITCEISAKHNSNPKGTLSYVCRAAHAKDYCWTEHIDAICTVKEHKQIPDDYASLLVCNTYVGTSFSVETWYKLEPTGRITTLRRHPFDPKEADTRFI